MSNVALRASHRSAHRAAEPGPMPGSAQAPQPPALLHGIGPAPSSRPPTRCGNPGTEYSLISTGAAGTKVGGSVEQRFAGVAHHIDVGQLAQSAHATKEAARKWKSGRSAPGTAKLLAMARTIPAVAKFVLSEIVGDENGPHAFNAVIAGLHVVAAMPGPEGCAARALLSRLMRG